MNILLHICCGPCLIYPWEQIKAQGFSIEGFFYNPNLDSQEEFTRRKMALEILNQDYKINLEFPQFEPKEFLEIAAPQTLAPERCVACWSLRLRRTAQEAKKRGYKFFSTTLLVSPFQKHELLKATGLQIAKETGLDFYYEDFRVGYIKATQEAKNRGLYRQKYCGCRYSLIESGKDKEK